MVYRVYVTRQPEFALDAKRLLRDIKENLQISNLTSLRLYNRYDVEGIDESTFDAAKQTVFSEPQTDRCLNDIDFTAGRFFAVEYLPGQFDQRADSCAQCIQLLTCGERPKVKTATVYELSGDLTDRETAAIKKYIINPVDSREAFLGMPVTLADNFEIPETVETLAGFTAMKEDEFSAFIAKYALAMDEADLAFCRDYFAGEHRDPTISELRLIDSYWSDHCRHTTFLTRIDNVTFEDEYIQKCYEDYIAAHNEYFAGRERPITLMDLGTIAAKLLSKAGRLKNIDKSEEINACSIKIKVDVDGKNEDWLLMFKNETHNHPTEIEPFGGAATCLGGAIRDPLSGRAYVYQAMRVTGAADPRTSVADTIPGKLPQAKLTLGAASGYSSYGNQIGLATGGVFEIYHPNYVAKRLEIGAVVGAAPEKNVIRTEPLAGDIVILLGGRTGRDGCGGATGSSKAHTSSSLSTCGAEVQKGNPPEERKIQRLFRNPEVTRLIKRCNDFGAGGVSVAIGELADGLHIDLSLVPKKYEGLDGTELAISESQERMAVVVAKSDAALFRSYAEKENLEATEVAEVTEQKRLVMEWNGKVIIDLDREFLNSNGAPKHTDIAVEKADDKAIFAGYADELNTLLEKDIELAYTKLMSDLNVCSKRGLVERFDSTIGGGSVVMPFGGKYGRTQMQYMAAKLPVLGGRTDTASYMAYGFDPYLSEKSPFHGALYAVVESVSRLVAAGVDYKDAYLTFQEYFEKMKNDPKRWGKPLAALLGAYRAQTELGIAAIGGKDSMSGSFEDIDVPPTLVSFAIAPGRASRAMTPEFKREGSHVYLLTPRYTPQGLPAFDELKAIFERVRELCESGKALSVYALGCGGIAEGVAKMCFGNKLGFTFSDDTLPPAALFNTRYGSFIVEVTDEIPGKPLGHTTSRDTIDFRGKKVKLSSLLRAWEGTLESVFPTVPDVKPDENPTSFSCNKRGARHAKTTAAKPTALITVFPGTNCEYDSARAFERAGGKADVFVFRNITQKALEESIDELAEHILNSQIFMLPGGFSGGDEPDGSGKFICAVLRSPKIREAVNRLLYKNDGLMLGICNGFQALLKVGLLPYGEIQSVLSPDAPTLTYNTIGRHHSGMVRTRIASVKSPWLAGVNVDDIHTIPVSHGEGRFIAGDNVIDMLARAGQIATQYVDLDGFPTAAAPFNPNGSKAAIEGIISPDGRVLGKMGHSERIDDGLYRNIDGSFDQHIFKSGVDYFR